MTVTETGAVRLRGREYPCYCKAPVSELVALPERERTTAWNHIFQHTKKGAA